MKDEETKFHIGEEENIGMAAEPVETAVRGDVSAQGYDIDKWPGMPLVGPANIDELNARIDQAEQEMDHDNGFSWDQVMLDAQTIVNRYANTITKTTIWIVDIWDRRQNPARLTARIGK